MTLIQWQKLDLQTLPEDAGIYAFLWRQQWLYIGKSPNLKQAFSIPSWPYAIASSLGEAEILWMPTQYCNDVEAKLRRLLKLKWRDIEETPAEGLYPQCFLPTQLEEAEPYVARSLSQREWDLVLI